MKQKANLYKMVLAAIFAAIVVVLQVISTYVKFGPISITLALVPIVVGGMLLGPWYGALFGGLMGIVILLLDPTAAFLMGINPFFTIIICILKSSAAGFASAFAYKCLRNINFYLAAILGTILAPVVNTGTFILGMFVFFKSTLLEWAGGENAMLFVITTIVGINFLVEFSTTLLLSPAILRILRIPQKNRLLN